MLVGTALLFAAIAAAVPANLPSNEFSVSPIVPTDTSVFARASPHPRRDQVGGLEDIESLNTVHFPASYFHEVRNTPTSTTLATIRTPGPSADIPGSRWPHIPCAVLPHHYSPFCNQSNPRLSRESTSTATAKAAAKTVPWFGQGSPIKTPTPDVALLKDWQHFLPDRELSGFSASANIISTTKPDGAAPSHAPKPNPGEMTIPHLCHDRFGSWRCPHYCTTPNAATDSTCMRP